MTNAVFIPDGDHFIPTRYAGSPWGETLVHGGPPAGLLARAIERHGGDGEMQVCRLTVDLFRPVPKVLLAVSARTVRAGARIHVVEASLLADGVEVTRATGLLRRRSVTGLPPPEPPPGVARPGGPGTPGHPMATTSKEDIARMPEGPDGIDTTAMSGDRLEGPRPQGMPAGFHTTIEVRRLPASRDHFPITAWIRIPVPLVAGEEITPLQRIAATSDFGAPFSGMGRRDGFGLINVDITLYLHRLPEGEWIGLQTERVVEPYGLGVADARWFDTQGLIGRSTHALLANRRR